MFCHIKDYVISVIDKIVASNVQQMRKIKFQQAWEFIVFDVAISQNDCMMKLLK